MPMTRGELGARRPVHVGTRLINAGSETTAVIAVAPVFSGETVERIALDCMAVTKDAETNVDQPPIFSWVGIFAPLQWRSDALTITDFESFVRDFQGADNEYLGGEPNPSGNEPWGRAKFGGAKVWFKRNVIGDPIPVGQDALNNADARFIDRFRTVVKQDIVTQADGVLIFAARMHRLDAQTGLGMELLDTGSAATDVAQAYRSLGQLGAMGGTALQIHELIYGGDNYVEADSFKETGRRHYAIMRPTIRRSEQLLR